MRIQTKYAAHGPRRDLRNGSCCFPGGPGGLRGLRPQRLPLPNCRNGLNVCPLLHPLIHPAGPSHVPPATQAAGAGRKRSTRHCQRTRRFSQPRMALAGRTTQQEERGGPRARAAWVQIPALPPAPSPSDLASDMITLRLSLSVRERESNSTLLTGDYENSLS